MTTQVRAEGHTQLEAGLLSWTSSDALLYAVSVGAGSMSPVSDLRFTTENSKGVVQQVLPTFLTVLDPRRGGSATGAGRPEPTSGHEYAGMLHAGQRIECYRPLPAAGSLRVVPGPQSAYDVRGHAIQEQAMEYRDPETDELVARSVSTLLVTGASGFGPRPAPVEEPEPFPTERAAIVVPMRTAPNQALLYRLNGDRNPLHSDPRHAAAAGFPQPILHGLCTYGMTGLALLHHVLDSDLEAFGAFEARFTRPVLPGQVLEVHVWPTTWGAHFQVRTPDAVVLDRGRLSRRTAATP